MPRTYVEEFMIGIGVDPSKVEKGVNAAVDKVRSGLSNALTNVVAPALAAVASGEMVTQFADEIAQVDRLSKSLGMNIEQLSAWRNAAEVAGVEADEVGEFFADINDWMLDLANNDSGPLKDFVEQGILPSVTDVNGQMKKTEDYVFELSDALQKMGPQMASGLARQIGIGNIQVAQWMQQGSEELKKQLAQGYDMGTFSKEDADAAKEFNAAILNVQHSIQMMLLPVFRRLAPVLTAAANGIKYLTQHATMFIPVLTAVGAKMALTAAGIGKVGTAITKLGTSFKAAGKFLMSPWGAILFALVMIGLLLDDFLTWLDGGESRFGEFYDAIFGGAEEAKKWLSEVGEEVSKIGEVLEKLSGPITTFAGGFMLLMGAVSVVKNLRLGIIALSGAMRVATAAMGPVGIVATLVGIALGALIAMNWEAFSQRLQEIGARISEVFEEVKQALSDAGARFGEAWNTMQEAAGNAIDGIVGFVQGLVDSFTGGVQGMVDTWNSLIDGAIETWNSFVDGIMSGIDSIGSAFDTLSSIITGFLSSIGASSLGQAIQQITNFNTTNNNQKSTTINYGAGANVLGRNSGS